MSYIYKFFFLIFLLFTQINASMTEDQMKEFIFAPMELGAKDESLPIWPILNSGGGLVGYIFESDDLVPTSGFSGGKMNLLISIDLEGNFIDVLVLEQSEPVFVGGIGIIPFNEFLRQYRGKSLASNIKVGRTDSASANTQIDNITKATASVKIANETILASAIQVARERLSGVAPKTISYPKKDLHEKLSWQQLLDNGLVKHLRVKNSELEELFKGTEFAGDDKIAIEQPNEVYADIWIADLGLPSISENILTKKTLADITHQLKEVEEPILILANGRHKIVSDTFVRNSTPDLLEIRQDDYPINLRDGDFEVELLKTIPKMEQAMIFQVDTRFGFDPSSKWTLKAKTFRGGNHLYETKEIRDLEIDIELEKKYFKAPQEKDTTPAWVSSWTNQAFNLSLLTLFIVVLFYSLYKYKSIINNLKSKRTIILIFTLFFIGWYGQGQLSMVTVLGFLKSIIHGQSLSFLLFDPFSLILWVAVILSLVIWGRGTFCGWLCPYGVLQELSHKLGTILDLPQIKVPAKINDKLIYLKYVILAVLCFVALFAPSVTDYLIEIEPFKTSITLVFDRSWPYVLYALSWIALSMVLFKGFCRFICPLGAFLSLGGKLRIFDWLPRRKECGNPCNHCHVSCNYEAIDKKDGHIKYDECFQCLDCVEIHHDKTLCKILIKAEKTYYEKMNKERKNNG